MSQNSTNEESNRAVSISDSEKLDNLTAAEEREIFNNAIAAVREAALAINSGTALNVIPELSIVIDLGGSLTKVAVTDKKGKRFLFGFKSNVSEIPLEIIEDKASQFLGKIKLESSMWTVLKNGRAFAVGSFALNQFRGRANLKSSKLKFALPKVLTALWVIKEKLGLASEFSASIGFLLPAGECAKGDIEELKQMLLPELSGFTTPTGKMRVSLVGDLAVKPEGLGMLMYYLAKNLKNDSSKRSVGFLGVGYRNSNMLICKNSGVSQKDRHTSELGFNYLLSEAKSYIGSALSDSQLNEIVILCGWDLDRDKLEQYLKSIGEINRFDSVKEGLEKAQKIYLTHLKSWLQSIEAENLQNIVIYGGAAQFLKVPFTEYFESIPIDSISWHGDVKIPEKLLNEIVVERDEGSLDVRFIDPWCYLHALNNNIDGYKKYGLKKILPVKKSNKKGKKKAQNNKDIQSNKDQNEINKENKNGK